MRGLFRAFLYTTLCVVFCAPFQLSAQDKEDIYDPEEERRGSNFEIDDIGRLIIGFNNKAYEDISGELFDRMSTHSLGVPINDYSTIIAEGRRKVFNNRNGTYTVLDLFGIQGVVAPGDSMILAGVPVYGAVGAQVGANFVNIRQVDDKARIGYAPSVMLPDDEWYSDLWHGVKSKWFGTKLIFDAANGTFNLPAKLFRSPSDEFFPRYGSPLEVTTPAFRIPFSARSFVEDRDPGEISSYTIEGGVFLSVGAGFVKERLATKISANLGYNVFLKVGARVSILKEKNGNFAKITVSIIDRNFGQSVSGKAKVGWDVIEGILFGADLSVSVTPFKISWGKNDIHQIDTTYRFDMRDPRAREAYEKATRGNFIKAEEMAKTTTVVTHPYDKEVETDIESFFHNYNLLIWRHSEKLEMKNSLVTITDDKGVSHVFKSLSHNEIKSGNIARAGSDKFHYFIETVMELEDPITAVEGINPVVQIALFSTDRHAYGYEVRNRLQMIEEIIRNPQFFDEGQYNPKQDYEHVSVDLEVKFYLEAIDQILEASKNEMWKALALAFNIKPKDWSTKKKRDGWVNWQTYALGLLRVRKAIERIRIMREAEGIIAYFAQIRDEQNKVERAKLLSKFHHESAFQWKVLTAMLSLANDENLYYRVSLAGDLVKNVEWEQGHGIEVKRPDLHEEDENIMRGRPTLDQASISNVSVSQPTASDRLKFVFKTEVDPSTIEGFYILINKIWIRWLSPKELYRSPNDSSMLHKDFEVRDNGEIWVYLDSLNMNESFVIKDKYEMRFAFKQKDDIFSKEVKFLFKYRYTPEMKIYWINNNGESEIK